MQPLSSWSRGSGALPLVQPPPPPKKMGFCMLQKVSFQALDFDIFLEEHDPGPL